MKKSLKRKWLVPALAAVMLLSAAGCAKEEEKPTFTGDTTEEPSYQINLNEISPTVYSEVRDLKLEPGTYISIYRKGRGICILEKCKKRSDAGGRGSECRARVYRW